MIEKLRKKEDDNGNFKGVVVDSEGDERLSSTPGKEGLMTIKELGMEMRESEDFGTAFTEEISSGSGSGGNNRSPGNGSGGKTVRISEAEANDPRKYRAAKARAEKAGVELEVY